MLLSLVLAAALVASPPESKTQAQEARSNDPVSEIDDVVVTGQRLRGAVNDFIGEIAAPAGAGRGLARWRHGLCVGVVNFRNEAGQYLADRVSDEARNLGLTAGEPGCKPSVIIVGTTDGAEITRDWVNIRPAAFHVGIGSMTRSRAALRRMQEGDVPVRWWHVSIPMDERSGEPAIRMPGQEQAPTTATFAASRLRTQVVDYLARVVIVVDVTKLGDVNLSQLGDYVTMIALAQVNPEGDTSGFDTVLNMFDDPKETLGITAWDREYLGALYGLEAGYVNRVQQAGAMADAIERGRRDAAERERSDAD